ncbi:insulinase family protein [Actinoplanes oblitus]|uniref:Insulinase family protein n=1 Tax=Actinoplanes oblitus TaxID=3040509 RepID=A0ABY8WH42_9ACTN|nr:insulinase family protein [Actinoplanes oblitus]WIM97196.1 insulinase family protein [Actinoplanes oblitus]
MSPRHPDAPLEVDGVPALLAPVSGPTHAGLVFRVGVVDEPLARRGITHLLEHLVAPVPVTAGTHRDSATGVEHTYFHVQGTDDEIVAFLAGVCDRLRDLPTGRIAAERDALRAEAATRRADWMPMWRHGARDFGMPSYPELGLDGLAPEHLNEWAARYFTRENAALWVGGEAIPAGLELDLPSGERRPSPVPSSTLPATPAYFVAGADDLGWDTVVPRGPRAAVFANLLERRMNRELPAGPDDADRVRTRYEPRADGSARIVAAAGIRPEHADAALDALVALLAEMGDGQIDAADVAEVTELTADGLRAARQRGARLPGQAFNLLTGHPVQSLGEAVAAVREVTRDDVAEVAALAYRAGLLMTPAGTETELPGYTAAPAASTEAVRGRVHRGRGNRELRLISGADGVSADDGETIATVRYDACAALLAWPDGGRQLIGEDAVVVRAEPGLYRRAHRVTAEIDARVPADRRIELAPREPAAIPRPARRFAWFAGG